MKSLFHASSSYVFGCCLMGAVSQMSCATSSNCSDYCPFRSLPERRLGYEIEWTSRVGRQQFEQLCGHGDPNAPPYIRFEVAIVRGTGNVHVGGRLRRELEPRLNEFVLGWSLSCRATAYVVVLRDKRDSCRVDRVIEVIGQYLRERNAYDRVVIEMGL